MALVMALVGFTACETDPTDMISKDAVAPVMDEHASILMTPNTLEETVSFTWKAARNLSGEVNYHLYATLDGKELQLATTQSTFYTVAKPALRQLLLNGFALDGNQNFEIGVYVVADNGVQALKSEAQTVKVYVYGDYMAPIVSIAEHIAPEGLVLTDAQPEEQVLLTWTEARFEQGQTVTYRVELELGDGFREILADGLEKTEYVTTWPKLNSLLLKKGFEKDKQYELSFVVTAISAATPDYNSEWLESQPVQLKVTTYTPAFPDFLYVIGDFCGHDGLNTLDKAPILRGDANEGTYHGVVTIYGGKAEFYYINPRTVNDSEPTKIFVGGTTESTSSPYYWTSSLNTDGDELAPQEGTYAFYVNLNEEYIRAFKINSVGLIGEKELINGIAEDWGTEAQFTFNENTYCYEMKVKFSKSGGGYKVRLNNNWNKPFPELNDGNDVSEPAYNFGQEKNVEHDPTTLVTLAWDQEGDDIVSAAGEFDVTIDFSTNANYSLQLVQTGVVNEYGVVGDYNQWGAAGRDSKFVADATQEGWYILEDFEVKEGEQLMLRLNDADRSTWGLETASEKVVADQSYTLKAGGEKFAMEAGTYDLHFNPTTLEFKATVAGAYYGLSGMHNNWGGDSADPQFMAADDKAGWLVLKNFAATAGQEAKVRMNDDWGTNWGVEAEIKVGETYTLSNGGSNFKWAASGTYNLYFNPTTLEFYIEEGAAVLYGLVGDLNGWNPADETYAMSNHDNGFKVIKGVTLSAGNFKIIEIGSWDNPDYGIPEGATLVLGEPVVLAVDGAGGNIPVEAGVYDIYFNPTTLTLYVVTAGAEDPTIPAAPEHLYGLVGEDNSWTDTPFVEYAEQAGYYKATQTLTANKAFKIRGFGEWNDAANYGVEGEPDSTNAVGVGTTFALVNGAHSRNMCVETTGTYDIYFNPTALKCLIVAEGTTPDFGGTTPEPTPTAVYGLVGQHNGWGGSGDDAAFVEYAAQAGYYKATQALVANEPFKIRGYNDGTWNNSYNYGVAGAQDSNNAVAVGTQFDLINGADARNMYVEVSGTYDIYFNPTDLKCLIMAEGTTPDFGGTTPDSTYSLAGSFNGFSDTDQTYTFQSVGGKLVLNGMTFATESTFKVIENYSWSTSYGGTLNDGVVALDSNGGDITIAAGIYDLELDVAALKLYVTKVGDVAPTADVYVLAGTHNDWKTGDTNSQFADNGSGTLVLKNITFGPDGQFKVVKNGTWCGGVLSNGEATLQLGGGDNLEIATGTYDFYLDPTSMKLTVVTSGTTPSI